MIGRALILTVFGMFVVSTMIVKNITRSTTSQNDNIIRYYQRTTGRNIAQGGINLALRQLANDRFWRAGFSSFSMAGGKVSVALRDVTFNGATAIEITSLAHVPFLNAMDSIRTTDTTFTSVAYVTVVVGSVPTRVLGAISTRNNVTTLGGLDVDGRDHDTTKGNPVIPGSGTYGIWTTGSLSVSGNSAVTGTNSSQVDFPLPKKGIADPSIVVANSGVWYPGTPDSVMGGALKGFPEGTLKKIAQSGMWGSQYVTDPSKLRSPFAGVTYVELSSGGVWGSMDITGSGILVVHNSATNAQMQNLNSGTFTGILIVDDLVRIHSTIIGAVITLSPNPSGGNTIGNGNGSVLFSRKAISAPAFMNTYTNKVLAWWE